MLEINPAFEAKVESLARQAMHSARLMDVAPDYDAAEHYTSKEYLETLKDDQVVGRHKHLYEFGRDRLAEQLLGDLYLAFPGYDPRVSGYFYYPPGGYMSWHTNSDRPERRVYVTWASHNKKSFFRSVQDGSIVTDWDKKGANVRVFDVTDKEPYYWHCVYSDCYRVSFGFRLMPK